MPGLFPSFFYQFTPYNAVDAPAEPDSTEKYFDIVAERGAEGIAKVRELSGGHGVPKVLEAVGHMPAYEQAYRIVRPGGIISRVGVPQYEEAPVCFGSLFGGNVTLTGGPAPVRAYIEQLMPAILDGTVNSPSNQASVRGCGGENCPRTPPPISESGPTARPREPMTRQ